MEMARTNEHITTRIRRRNRFLGVIALLIFGMMVVSVVPLAQTKNENRQKLENKKKKLEEEIEYNKKLLEETRKNKSLSVNELNLLRKQIESREALLDEINNSIDSLDRAIRENNKVFQRQEQNLAKLKEEYGRMIYHAWKIRSSHDRMLFIFAARDFDEAFQRMKYFQQYSDSRKRQAEQINKAKDDVKQKVFVLNEQKTEREILLSQNETEVERLDREKAEKDAMVAQLKKKEASIKKTLNAKKDEARKLQQKIESIIAAEIKKSADKTNKTPTNNVVDVLTPEEKLLSDNFVSNKGKLPWPVASGVISSSFGEHDHPVLPGIKTKNNGVDIATTKGNSVRAVFNGTVVSVVNISETNRVVIIRHGGYFTVYSNLKSTSVAQGATVTTKQIIGVVATDAEENKTAVHFEVWEGEALHNPAYWLAPR
jgi:septal ring factor EnvC (AmiA/AmiB activator)